MKFYLIFLLLILFNCSDSQNRKILLEQLYSTKDNYNENLFKRSDGLHNIKGYNVQDSSFGLIMVHGYYPKNWQSKGFEWIEPMYALSKNKIPMWFFKFDWEGCSSDISDSLKKHVVYLIENNNHLDSLWFMGHSYGGLISSLLSEKWDIDFPISVHSIAAPLKGISRSDNSCPTTQRFEYNIAQNVKYTQWKTIQSADGAFKHLNYDPQMIKINNGEVITLPSYWEDKRLGHNRSILFVAEQLTH